MKYIIVLYFICITFQIAQCVSKPNKKLVLEDIADIKDFKKLLRTKTNVLVCFYNAPKQVQNIVKVFREVAENVKGEGTMTLIDCSGSAKKMCKKLKVQNEPFIIKHYKDGDFNKNYDRKLTVSSMTNFMRDPTGDLPWEEDTNAPDVVHIPDANTLAKLIKKEGRPILIMFYAPWCTFCKSLKPDFAEAATELKDEAVLAAIDVNRPENTAVRSLYNITGFPTLLYFVGGQMKFTYSGENKKNAIVSFVRNPHTAPVKVQEPEWSDLDSEVVHLTSSSFDPVIKEEASVLVMFYAPWCGHCKKMKPEYESAAAQMKSEGIPGMLAAVDATKEPQLASRFTVRGYPTVMYFSYGEQKFDVNLREAPKIIEFMRDPREPPPPPPPEKPWSDEESDIVHLTEETFKSFLKKKKHVLVIFYVPWCGHCKSTKPEFANAAAQFRDDPKVEFAAVDCTAHQGLCSANNVTGYPTLKYFSYYTKDTRVYKGERKAVEFVHFMKNPSKVSGSSPPVQNKESWKLDPAIALLNDNNFKQHIEKNSVVLVMFYAPWCGHCKKMKSDYVLVAKELHAKGFHKCMAMVDCTENPEVTEEYEISGFPTIKLYVKGRYVKDYNGPRTSRDLKNFILPYMHKDEL